MQGALGEIYAATEHYPFKAWPGIKGWSKPNAPPKKPMNLSAFVGTDVNFVGNSLLVSPLQVCASARVCVCVCVSVCVCVRAWLRSSY